MECLGRMRAAAFSLPFCDWKCRRRLATVDKRPLLRWEKRSIRLLPPVLAGRATTEVKGLEEFADEEDYIKAGGSELFLVKMQERKPMEKQSKIADKVFTLYLLQILKCFFLLILFSLPFYRHFV